MKTQSQSTISPAANVEPGALALMTINPAQYVTEIYQSFRAKLDRLKTEADAIVTLDVTTKEGMSTAIRLRAAFRDDVRCAAENARKERKAPILEIGRMLDARNKEIAEEVEPYESRFDDAIKAEEKRKAAEKAEKDRIEAERVAAIRAKIADIAGLPAKNAGSNSATLHAVLSMLAGREIEAFEFAEFTEEARAAVNAAGPELESMYTAAKAREQEEADRIAALAAEQERIRLESEANRVRQAELDARAAAIEAQRKLAEQEAQAEARRQADERAAFEAERQAFAEAQEAARVAALPKAGAAEQPLNLYAGGTFSLHIDAVRAPSMSLPESITEQDALIDAVPADVALHIDLLQNAVKALIQQGYTADAVRALVEAELVLGA